MTLVLYSGCSVQVFLADFSELPTSVAQFKYVLSFQKLPDR